MNRRRFFYGSGLSIPTAGLACQPVPRTGQANLRIRGMEGGKVSPAWREKGATEIKALDSSTSLIQQSNEDWQTIDFTIPTKVKIEIIRLMLSTGEAPVEIGSYSIKGADGGIVWDFIKSK